MANIQNIIDNILTVVDNHKISDGQYARWLWNDPRGSRELGLNPYGCADAANILYSLGHFPTDTEERLSWVKALQTMQSPDTGLFHEKTHHPIHITAHCTAALELFDAVPLYPMSALLPTKEPEKLENFLDSLDWHTKPWSESHQGAGIYVAMNLTHAASPEWNQRYFNWLWEACDPVTGLWRISEASTDVRPLYEHMAGSFHYLFNHEYAHMPLRYPEKMIDSCIYMYKNNKFMKSFGAQCNFIEIDWIFCLTRASRQTPHRYYEIRECLRDFTDKYLSFWNSIDWMENESANDLHLLFGGVCALAELQQTLRGELVSDIPLKLVLDRRPFI